MARLRDNPRRPTVNDVLPADLWAERARTPDGVHVIEPAPEPVWHGPPAVWTPLPYEFGQAVDALERACNWWTARLQGMLVVQDWALLYEANAREEMARRLSHVARGDVEMAADLVRWWPTRPFAWWQRLGPVFVCCDGPGLQPTHAAAVLGYSVPWASYARSAGRMPVEGGRVPRVWVRSMLAEGGGQRRPLPEPPEPLLGY